MSRLRRITGRLAWTLTRRLPTTLLSRVADEMLRSRHLIHDVLRQRRARRESAVEPALTSCRGERLSRSVLERSAPWDDVEIPACSIPGMLTEVEKRYYGFITSFFSGAGAFVEVGPWLGMSTHYLLSGLQANPAFKGKKIHVFDDFVWRSSWMEKWLEGSSIASPPDHASFQALFREQTRDFAGHLVVRSRRIIADQDNRHLPPLAWDGGPVEMIVVDCGRSLAVNEGWWEVFESAFIADRTLIVMQDWQNYKRVPEVFWENTKIFTDGKADALDLVHEVAGGGIATFLYRG